MSGQGGSVWWRCRFEASLGLLGVPTLDRRVLTPPPVEDGEQWMGKLPVPVVGPEQVDHRGMLEKREWERDDRPVALIDRVFRHEEELVACGYFSDGERGRNYAGALAVDAVAFAVNLEGCGTEGVSWPGVEGVVTVFSEWQIAGAYLVHQSPWDPRLTSRPKVWQTRVEAL